MPTTTPEKYLEAVGRRKTAVARIRLFEKGSAHTFTVNSKNLEEFFPLSSLQKVVADPLERADLPTSFFVSVLVKGGGMNAQAEAIRHGIARALLLYDPELRKVFREFGFLKRDPRQKERKKFGLKKARKSPQWSKR